MLFEIHRNPLQTESNHRLACLADCEAAAVEATAMLEQYGLKETMPISNTNKSAVWIDEAGACLVDGEAVIVEVSALLVQRVAGLVDGPGEALSQVMLLEARRHAHVGRMRACTGTSRISYLYVSCKVPWRRHGTHHCWDSYRCR